MARHHGSHGEVSVAVSGTGTTTPIASLNNWTLDMTRDMVEVTAFQDVNKSYVPGLPDIKGTFAGFLDDADEAVFAAADSATPVLLKLVPTTLVAGLYWEGPAAVDASLEVAADGAVTISGNFTGTGAWARTWPAAAARAA